MDKIKTLLGVSILFFGSVVNATLINRGNGMIYDSDQDITWLQDANYAKTQSFGVSGITANGGMIGSTAFEWIAGMNADNFRGISNWRLPYTPRKDSSCSGHDNFDQFDGGFLCTGSELGHLFYIDLLGQAGASVIDSNSPYLDLFINIQNFSYWSNYTNLLDPSLDSFQQAVFWFNVGGTSGEIPQPSDLWSAWAVVDGDVFNSAPTIPEPSVLALILTGLFGIGLARNKQRLSSS